MIFISQFILIAFQTFYLHMIHGHLNPLKHLLMIYKIVSLMLVTLFLLLNRSRKSSTIRSNVIFNLKLMT